MGKDKTSGQRDLATGELFTRLLVQNQKRIYGLILALVPNGPDADDILQEACSVMWRRFDEFEQGTNFSAWALRIARFQVMAYYTNQKRKRARLTDENVEAMIDKLASRLEKADDRAAALDGCLGKLTERDRRLLILRYQEGASVTEAAEQCGRSVPVIYKLLNRIHEQLLDCISRKLKPKGAV